MTEISKLAVMVFVVSLAMYSNESGVVLISTFTQLTQYTGEGLFFVSEDFQLPAS